MGMFTQNVESAGNISVPGNVSSNSQSSSIQVPTNNSSSTPTGPAAARPPAPPMGTFRGRGTPIASMALRGRGAFPRGRGRGGMFGGESGR